MIKSAIFDLDGVLIKTKDIHYESLNDALREISERYVISKEDHLSIFDGLNTKDKLRLISKKGGLPESLHAEIWERKQRITKDRLKTLNRDENIVEAISFLAYNKVKIACCSNSIKESILICLDRLGILKFFDAIYSNEDVSMSKPYPEIYWRAMIDLKSAPEETLIFEDSPVGILAAKRSGANVYRIESPKNVNRALMEDLIKNKKNMSSINWENKSMNVLIPMAGAGSRFEKAGYTFPKPLIDVKGKPMIQTVVDNLGIEANFIFVVRKEHREKYNLDNVLALIAPKCKIVETDGITEGAACTTLLAEEFINNDHPLLIANSDQFVEWNPPEFYYKFQEQDSDASMLIFKSVSPKWSFAEIGEDGYVKRVKEKDPISDNATVGIYIYKNGSDYVKYAKEMISENDRHNGEFYVCPIFNYFIRDGKKVTTYNIEKMWGLGTPEDLEYFLSNYDKS